MKTRILLYCGVLILISHFQEILGAPPDDVPPLPPGPLLQKMTGFSAIQINYTYASDQTNSASTTAPAQPPAPTLFPTTPIRQFTLTRTKPLWCAVRLDVDGNTVAEWYNGSDYFYIAPGIPEPLINDPPVDAEPVYGKKGASPNNPTAALPDFNQFDFPDMDWISAKTYTGVEVINGHRCLIFKNQRDAGSNKDDETAWIDIETRFPVQWQRGEETRTFQQLPPPDGPLVLPAKIAHLATGMKRDRDRWANFSVPAPKNQPEPNK